MRVLGFDIGGANLKMCDADGHANSVEFPMWTQHNRLTEMVAERLAAVPHPPELVSLTMTAELADCFATKAEGVEHVIDCVTRACAGVPVRVWLTSGEFAEPDDARELPSLVAAANWHALATWAARAVPDGPALLIDIGSTTTDIIPLLDGRPVPQGWNDPERLQSGELVYTGAHRTPVCAVVSSVPFRNQTIPVAAEWFATMADVLVVAGLRDPDETCCQTADNRPLTLENSQRRLARMICCDLTEVSADDVRALAEDVIAQQQLQLNAALTRVLTQLQQTLQDDEMRSLEFETPTVILSGSGTIRGQRLLDSRDVNTFRNRLVLSDMFRHSVAESACAFAVARLAHDRCRDDLLHVKPIVT